jgi:uracil-DNA glycosylase
MTSLLCFFITLLCRTQVTKEIENLEKEYFNFFEKELKILNPDIIIFTTGNRKIPIKHKKIKSIQEKPVSEVELENYPNIIAVRTYHPNARIKGGKKKFKKEIVDLIRNKIRLD